MRRSARSTTRWGITPIRLIPQPRRRRPVEVLVVVLRAGALGAAQRGNQAEGGASPSTLGASTSRTMRPVTAATLPVAHRVRAGAAFGIFSPAFFPRDTRSKDRRQEPTSNTR